MYLKIECQTKLSLYLIENRGWREGVGVEPTQGFLRPHTGFEDQKAHRDLYPPVCQASICLSSFLFVRPDASKYSRMAWAYLRENWSKSRSSAIVID